MKKLFLSLLLALFVGGCGAEATRQGDDSQVFQMLQQHHAALERIATALERWEAERQQEKAAMEQEQEQMRQRTKDMMRDWPRPHAPR